MPVVTIISDWDVRDYFHGAVKGALMGAVDNINIIDIAHGIPKHDIVSGLFVLKSCFRFYPAGTVHLFCIRSESSNDSKAIIVKYKEHYFIGNELSLSGLGFEEDITEIVAIDSEFNKSAFPELEVFVPAAIHLLSGKSFEEAGTKIEENLVNVSMHPLIRKKEDSTIVDCHVVYIDSYGNLVSNLTKDKFNELVGDKKYVIYVENNNNKITKISKSYLEAEKGDIVAIFNSLGLLEIAIVYGNARELIEVGLNSIIRIVI